MLGVKVQDGLKCTVKRHVTAMKTDDVIESAVRRRRQEEIKNKPVNDALSSSHRRVRYRGRGLFGELSTGKSALNQSDDAETLKYSAVNVLYELFLLFHVFDVFLLSRVSFLIRQTSHLCMSKCST